MQDLENLSRLIRYFILTSTTEAGSGHPTSSLSSVELMATLMFGGFFKFDIDTPANASNDRLIFSKGHASPLLYSLWAAAGAISEKELMTLRKFGSKLEGHPSIEFPFTEVPTGSLGQGLSAGVGFALNSKYLDKTFYKTFVLLGDSEMAEGSVWEAIQLASFYKLNNLIGIIDVNRLGQRGETMLGWNVKDYSRRVSGFGWETIVIDGHSFEEVSQAFNIALSSEDKPVMIIAKTIKGKGVSFLENKEGWHGKTLSKEELKKALEELGQIDTSLRGKIVLPGKTVEQKNQKIGEVRFSNYQKEIEISTRQAYGNALVRLEPAIPNLVVIDGEVSNSTFSESFKNEFPDKFFEMYVAEQNMVGVAMGLSKMKKIIFASSFAAFWSRAHDQIRMASLANSNIKFVGSHAGVSIGEDGPSQMGLEDISLFRTLPESVVLYPCDAISTEKLVAEAAKHYGLVYLRTTRGKTPVIYDVGEEFPIGGSKILKQSKDDKLIIVTAGITVFEAIKAWEELSSENIFVRIVDAYSIKPIDTKSLSGAESILTIEDHYREGGLGDAVRQAVSEEGIKVWSLGVHKKPKSGKPDELLAFEEINKDAIVKTVREILR